MAAGRPAALAVAAAIAAAIAFAAAAAALAAPAATWEAHATPACSVLDAEKVWRAYDDIYTGAVVSVERPRSPGGADGWRDGTARVHFEVSRTLKGDPQPARWHADVPAPAATCRGPGAVGCAASGGAYAPGTEVFYLDGFNGAYPPVSGACGVGSAEAGAWIGVPGMVFSYYESLYGFSPPRDEPCGDPAHVLVARGRGDGGRDGAACVSPSTAERLGWERFDREEWARSHAPPPPGYDLPIVRAAEYAGRAYDAAATQLSLSISRLPAAGEEAVVTASYGPGIAAQEPRIILSPNLEFVGLDGVEAWRSYYPNGTGSTYRLGMPAGGGGVGEEGGGGEFTATVRAVSEGYAAVSYGVDGGIAQIEMHVGRDAGLLVDDYHRAAAPLPDMSAFRDSAAGKRVGGGAGPAMPAMPPPGAK